MRLSVSVFFCFQFLFSKFIFQLRSNDPNMTYFQQLAVLWNLQNCPPVINYFTIYATAKGHPHKYVIYSQPKVNIAKSIENCVHFKLYQQSGPNNKLYSIIGSIRIHQEPKIWNHKLVNFPVRQRKKCKILDDQEDT